MIELELNSEERQNKKDEWEESQKTSNPLLSGKKILDNIIKNVSVKLKSNGFTKSRKNNRNIWISLEKSVFVLSFQKHRFDEIYECSFKIAYGVVETNNTKPDVYESENVRFIKNAKSNFFEIDSWNFSDNYVESISLTIFNVLTEIQDK